MLIETWPVEKLQPYTKNARRIPQSAIDAVAKSIAEFGWRQPIVVDEAGVIVIGHVRRLAALQLLMTLVPVHVARGLSPEKIRALRLMDNRSHDEAQWDPEILTAEMLELRELDLDLSLTGFSTRELDGLLLTADERADDCPAVPEVAISRTGDLWLAGSHRILSGDATSAADVERLLGGAKPFLMVTDPPYGVDYDPGWREEAAKSGRISARGKFATAYMASDTEAAWKKSHELFPGGVAYVWHTTRKAVDVAIALQECDFEIRAQIIWKKQHLVFSRGHYHIFHEPCWYCVRRGSSANWQGDAKQSTWWDVANLNRNCGNTVAPEDNKSGHAAQKPVELFRRSIKNHLRQGEGVYDPFLGSGTCLIAAEDTGRVCSGLELDPRYIDLIVRRWQDFTGKEATLEGDGRTFAEIAAARGNAGAQLGVQDALKEEAIAGTTS